MNGEAIQNGAARGIPVALHPSDVEHRIRELSDLSLPQLRKRWTRTFNAPVPQGMSRDLLVRGLAYRLQEQVLGALSRSTKRRLNTMAGQLRHDRHGGFATGTALKAGTKLVREWQARSYSVIVLEDGFAYDGKRYRSLSMIAREITGARWSVPRFFGLNGRSRENADAAR